MIVNRQAIVDPYKSDGFVVVPALFSQEEIDAIKSHFMALNKAGHGFEGDRHTLLGEEDPLKAYPRIVHPHRFDELSLNWLLDDRLRGWTTTLLGRDICRPNHVLFQATRCPRTSIASRSAPFAGPPGHLPGGMDGGGHLR